MKRIGWMVAFLLAILGLSRFDLQAEGQKSRQEIIAGVINHQMWEFVRQNELAGDDDSFRQLIAALIKVERNVSLTTQEIARVEKIGDGSDNGFKGLLAYQILISAGKDLSDKAFEGLVKSATAPEAWFKADEKRLVAIWVLLSYQEALQNGKLTKKTQ